MFFSLRNRLFMIFTLLLTFPFLVLSILIPNWFTSIMEERTKSSTIEMMEQYSLYIDSITSQAEDLGKQVLVNPTTQEWIKSEENDREVSDAERLLMKNQLKAELSSMMINNSKAMSVSVYLNDGTGTAGNLPPLEKTIWFDEFYKDDQRWLRSHNDLMADQVNSYLLPLFDINTLDLSGVIKVNFPSSLLENALSKIKLGENGRVYLLDSLGRNVLTGSVDTPENVVKESLKTIKTETNSSGLIEVPFEKEEYMIFYQKAKVGEWVLVREITKSELFSQVNELQRNLLLTSGWIFLLTIMASYLFSSTIVKPLGKLTGAMKLVEKGEFKKAKQLIPSIKTANDEIGYVVDVFGQTANRLDTLIETEYEANIRRRDAEYKALLLQINPHFLNNTLETIGGLAAQGKNKEVIDVTIHLGRIMRYSLNTESDMVTLGEEMTYIRRFMEILKLRYEEALSVSIQEDPAASPLPIIKFVIQPLVENSVKYSFIEKTEAVLRISTKKVNDWVEIVIEDNGIGIPESIVEELKRDHGPHESSHVLESKGRSIGLKNVLGRLKLYYGENFTYHISSKEYQGTTIVLRIKSGEGDLHAEGDSGR
ncbi:sensor histidine kinase [Rossellomorea aquimaris]|uniref:HAMP domain-containing protein n=1 Tax=Rossellomorea aquimaris TaxID=189382 RepID=A0A5D4U382_9BACI|nr:sensor histidine kinase [Rossellomorea aquimaris]TYS81746.1 HAMP domain-containing protein [Rossellomorea aquimaris]TYS88370.1 HAMP domain-containing protein [Rossellomorea aquimaris]